MKLMGFLKDDMGFKISSCDVCKTLLLWPMNKFWVHRINKNKEQCLHHPKIYFSFIYELDTDPFGKSGYDSELNNKYGSVRIITYFHFNWDIRFGSKTSSLPSDNTTLTWRTQNASGWVRSAGSSLWSPSASWSSSSSTASTCSRIQRSPRSSSGSPSTWWSGG